MKEIEVKPRKGLIVRDPFSYQPIPDGKWTRVPYNTFWRRQVHQTSVEMREVQQEEKMITPVYENKKLNPGGKDK